MADIVFNIAKGAMAEKVRDGSSALGVLLLKTVESDALMKDRATIAAVLSGSTEAGFTNYARKTGLSGTVTVDNSADKVFVALSSSSLVWSSAGGGTDDALKKLVVFYDEGGTDATRIPLVALDCVITTNGGNLTVNFNASGFVQAA